ncbi:MAG: coenzyme F420-0:L-glutamate ligase [Rubrobacteraceae bacterium]
MSDIVEVIPVEGVPEVRPDTDLPEMLFEAAGGFLRPGDILVVTHKIASKAEGRIVDLTSIEPSALAEDFASRFDKDPRQVEVVLRESKRIVKMDRGVIISETRHGFVCANAGVDASNVPGNDAVCLLPEDPDASARLIHDRLRERISLHVPVVVSDSFGRPWRNGITNVAIGVAGMNPFVDYRGTNDPHGYSLEASVLAVADELASASELVMNKTDGVPAAIVRGYPYDPTPGSAKDLVMDPERDLFR